MAAMNKRVLLTGPKTVEIVESPIQDPPPKGMVVKVKYAGVCHTDVHLWLDKYRVTDEKVISFEEGLEGYTFPRVMGHEIAGEVYSLGSEPCPDAPDWKIGDRVLVYPYTGCETCGRCKANEDNKCDLSLAKMYGIGKDGGQQGYISVKYRTSAQKLPDNINMDVACQLTCSALTAYNGVTTVQSVVEDSLRFTDTPRVLVVGAGGLGLWGVQWARALLPKQTKIYVADTRASKIEHAKAEGADGGVVWPFSGDAAEVAKMTKEQCGGEFDAALDFVGAGSTANFTFQCMRFAGIQVLIGLAGGTLPVPVAPSALRMINLQGVYVGSPAQMAAVARLVSEGKVKSPPITVFKPEQAGEVMQMLVDGKLGGRGVLDFTK